MDSEKKFIPFTKEEVAQVRNLSHEDYVTEFNRTEETYLGMAQEANVDELVRRYDLLLAAATDTQFLARMRSEAIGLELRMPVEALALSVQANWESREKLAKEFGVPIAEREMAMDEFIAMAKEIDRLAELYDEIKEHPEKLNDVPFGGTHNKA